MHTYAFLTDARVGKVKYYIYSSTAQAQPEGVTIAVEV